MDKRALIIVAVIIVVVGVGVWYYYLRNRPAAPTADTKALEGAGQAAEAITKGATGGVLPDIGTAANPLSGTPNVNPAENANPFRGVKTNPFQ
jgi:hypothetical protein